MTRRIVGRSYVAFTFLVDAYPMRTSPNSQRADWTAFLATSIDPAHELDAVTSSLQILRLDDQPASTGSLEDLVDLHGALLLFQLGGQAELLPSTGFTLFGMRSLERRIVRAASRIAGSGRGERAACDAWLRAGERIEQQIGLIDPELCQLVA